MARKRKPSKQGPPPASSSSESATSKRQKTDATRVVSNSDSDSDSGKSLSSPNGSALTLDPIVPNSNTSAPIEVERDISVSSDEDDDDFWAEYPLLEAWFAKQGRSALDYIEKNADSIGRDRLKRIETEEKRVRIGLLEVYVEKFKLYQSLAEQELDYLKGNRV